MHSIDWIINERARLTQFKGNNSILKKQLKENDTKWKKELEAKDTNLSFFKNEVKDQEEMLKALNDKFNYQEAELSQLKVRLEYLED